MIHFAGVYAGVDFILIITSFIAIAVAKKKAKELIEDPKFKEYT